MASVADAGSSMEPEKRRKKIGQTKKSAFKPQPVQLPKPSDTPPEEEEEDIRQHLPPPPSERKNARRRESTRAIRERVPQSPSPPPVSKRQKTNPPIAGSSSNTLTYPPPTLPSLAASTSRSHSHVEGLNFHPAFTSRPRPSMPRLPSPERTISVTGPAPAWGSKSVMGPPEVFVRKTRKSMGVNQLPLEIRADDELVPLPESETPMIRKNKELREAQSRRTSLGMRGQRSSSSLGRGDLSVPHPSVDSKLFYTHISSATPEPIRARHLLVYCFDRAAKTELEPPKKSKTKTRKTDGERTEEGDRLVADIIAEFSRTLGQGGIDTNVFGSGPNPSSGVPLRPHPKNAQNRLIKQKEDALIRRCKDECNEWARYLMAAKSLRKTTVDSITKKAKLDKDPDMTPLVSSSESWMGQALQLAEDVIESGEGDLLEMGEFHDVEYKVDVLHQFSHAALNFTHQATTFLDGIFKSLKSDLDAKGNLPSLSSNSNTGELITSIIRPPTNTSTSTSTSTRKGKDPIHMLRALAAAESTRVSEETLAAAAAVPPAVHIPSAVGVGATPRRKPQGGVGVRGTTPRRTGRVSTATAAAAAGD